MGAGFSPPSIRGCHLTLPRMGPSRAPTSGQLVPCGLRIGMSTTRHCSLPHCSRIGAGWGWIFGLGCSCRGQAESWGGEVVGAMGKKGRGPQQGWKTLTWCLYWCPTAISEAACACRWVFTWERESIPAYGPVASLPPQRPKRLTPSYFL